MKPYVLPLYSNTSDIENPHTYEVYAKYPTGRLQREKSPTALLTLKEALEYYVQHKLYFTPTETMILVDPNSGETIHEFTVSKLKELVRRWIPNYEPQ